MRSLIDDLLKYAGTRTGAGSFRRLSLRSVVSDVINDLQVGIEEAHAVVEIHELPEVIADEVQMRQVFQNLMGNAIKYRSPERPLVIDVAAEKTPTEWVVSVRDNGNGFDMAYAEQIFRRFQRLETRDAVEGTGLGLTITKKIVEAHDGHIWVESIPAAGSTFFFTLPR